MKIFNDIKILVKEERKLTHQILEKLMYVERDKLYADLKYPSMFKYLVKELGYTDAEATIRVNTVRLMLKSQSAKKKIISGKLSLSNASEAHKVCRAIGDKSLIENLVEVAANTSARDFKEFIQKEMKQERKEVVVLPEYVLKDFDRVRKKYGNHYSTFELIQILLEKELRAPVAKRRGQHVSKNSRYISKSIKEKVNHGKCVQCERHYGLEYDHKVKYSHGGDNSVKNIQVLCKTCNQRKEIVQRQSGVFI